jgi:hypothetical protein
MKIFIWKGGIMYVNGQEKEVKAIKVKEIRRRKVQTKSIVHLGQIQCNSG